MQVKAIDSVIEPLGYAILSRESGVLITLANTLQYTRDRVNPLQEIIVPITRIEFGEEL